MKRSVQVKNITGNGRVLWGSGAIGSAVIASLLVLAAPAQSQTQPPPPRSLAPTADFSKICVQPPKARLTRDWKKWDKAQPAGNLDEMYEAALLYADGGAQVTRDPQTARKLLEELIARSWPGRGRAHYRLGRLLLDPDAGPVDPERAASLFSAASSMLNMDATVQLAYLHQDGRIPAASVTEAERLLRTASAAGNVDGVIGLARLQRSGKIGDVPKAATDDLVKLGLLILYGDLGKGKCGALYEIGSILGDEALVPGGLTEAMKWHEAAGRHGDPRGDMALAEIYTQGRVGNDPTRVVRHLTRAAEAGMPKAMTLLAERLLSGNGATKDASKAIGWLEKAGANADPDAYRLLARHYRGEFGGAQDLPKAADALQRAVALPGHRPSVLMALGRLHAIGVSGKPDMDKALSFYRRAADRGETGALPEMAKLLLQAQSRPSADEALRLLNEAASQGNADSMGMLSELYACSTAVSPDPEQARAWRMRAAEAGHVRSILALAAQASDDPEASRRRAAALLRAAERGDRESMVMLSFAYRSGQGVERNEKEAARWRDAALAPGEDRPRALLMMARGILREEAGARDNDAARSLLEEAAQEGDPTATFELGRFILSTKAGNAAEEARALQLLQKSAGRGNATAMLSLSELSDEQLRPTGRTALEWKKAAAEAGSARAAIVLARAAKEQTEAAEWLTRAEMLPICTARDKIELAQAYQKASIANSGEHARMWLERALNDARSEEQDPTTLFLIGRAMLDGIGGASDSQSALNFLRQSADAGKVEAMRFLGRAYAAGNFGERDAKAALDWLSKALRSRDDGAAVDLARLAATSEDDAAQIVTHLKDAAEAGFAPAMREYGRTLQFGLGVPAAPEAGAEWLRKAADQGDTLAMKELSRAYASGYGVELSAPASTEWLLRAATAGDAEAMYGISLALTLGFGIQANAAAAQEWLASAEAAGRK